MSDYEDKQEEQVSEEQELSDEDLQSAAGGVTEGGCIDPFPGDLDPQL